MSIRAERRGDRVGPAGPAPGRSPDSPDAAGSRQSALLELQQTAGNRAVARMLQRKVPRVLSESVGEDFAGALTQDELRDQIGVLIDALDSPKGDAADRETWEQNLELLEVSAAGKGLDLPFDTGFHARAVLKALSTDLVGMLNAVKEMKPDSDYSDEWRMFKHELTWQVEQLEWIGNTIVETAHMTQEAQKGGPNSAAQFREIGVRLNALIFAIKIMEIFTSHLRVALTVFGHLTYDHLTQEMGLLHRELDPALTKLKLLDNRTINEASKAVLDYNWRWEFLNWIDELEDAMKSWRRFTGFVNIALLALTLYDVWALPGVGGGGAPPPIAGGGMGGAGAVAVATDVLASAESLEAIGRLVAIGAIESPGLVKVLGGRGVTIERPPAPMEASVKGSGGGSGKAPPSTTRVAKGLPSPEEDTIVQRYTRGLANLREKLRFLRKLEANPPRDPKAVTSARTAVETADRELQAIEDEAARRHDAAHAADPAKRVESELLEHLDPLARERAVLKGSRGLDVTTTGTKVKADAVEHAPKNLRDLDFAEIKAAMDKAEKAGLLKRPPKVTPAAKDPGGTLAQAHQRIEWEFKDGSKVVVDQPAIPKDPARAEKLPESAKRPHAELHGPKGERLNQEGIEVPEKSISAHMTITDRAGGLEGYFAPARKGR